MHEKGVLTFNGAAVPEGETIQVKDGKAITPDKPIIPFIEGDGIGAEITAANIKVVNSAVAAAYNGKRQIQWFEIFAGGKAVDKFQLPLPIDTIAAIRQFKVAIKGPLATPTGGGMRSLNVAMRKEFDLYQCIRPVRWYEGVPSPVVRPQDLDIVIFRENTEDVYAGIEFKAGSPEALELIEWLSKKGFTVRADSGMGIKPISEFGSKRLVRRAIEFAIKHKRKGVTLVGKGNIQKFTEGAFLAWGHEVAKAEFGDRVISEAELWSKYNGKLPEDKVVLNTVILNDRIADAMFCELLVRPTLYSVVATTNLNGDLLSDAAAAQVGGLGMAPGANIGENCAIFEATHGTAPDIAGKNIANPSSLILSSVMMLEYMGWTEAAALIVSSLEKTIKDKTVTGDLARLMPEATRLSTSEFADALVKNMPSVVATPVAAPAVAEPKAAESKAAEPKAAEPKADATPAKDTK